MQDSQNHYKVVPTTSSQVVKMDISRKLYKDDIVILNDIQNQLLRQDIKTSQKELIDKAVRFVAKHKEEFFEFVGSKEKDNTAEKVRAFLKNAKTYDLGDNWLEEIDTTL